MATHSHYTQMHGAETVVYSVFWAAGLVVPSNGFRCRTHQWNMDLVGKDFLLNLEGNELFIKQRHKNLSPKANVLKFLL